MHRGVMPCRREPNRTPRTENEAHPPLICGRGTPSRECTQWQLLQQLLALLEPGAWRPEPLSVKAQFEAFERDRNASRSP